MKNNNRCSRLQFFAVVFTFSIATSSNAALVSRLNGQAVYDTDLNVTWLADTSLASSITFGLSGINADGSMNLSTANAWVNAMNTSNYLGYNNWRLPIADPNCGPASSLNCINSEMGHLFYVELGGIGGSSILTNHNSNLSQFQNVQSNVYWSGTGYPAASWADWNFDFSCGCQGASDASNALFVWVVRPGDVATVPIPAAFWLFGSGLLGLIGVARASRFAH